MAYLQCLNCGNLCNEALATAVPASADSDKRLAVRISDNRKPAGMLKSRANVGLVGGAPTTSDAGIQRLNSRNSPQRITLPQSPPHAHAEGSRTDSSRHDSHASFGGRETSSVRWKHIPASHDGILTPHSSQVDPLSSPSSEEVAHSDHDHHPERHSRHDAAFWIAMDLKTPISSELERARNTFYRREDQQKKRADASHNVSSS